MGQCFPRVALVLGLVSAGTLFALGATPPSLLNYQGVLRDATDEPLSGNYDMTFRFFDALTAGNEILVDAHTLAGASQVVVDGGLFNVQLGGGTVTDGSGAGTYTSLSAVFRDYAAVYLSIKVGAETLSPRVRIVAAGYALNAGNLDGKASSNFLDISSTSQTKAGQLVCSGGVEGAGTSYGGYFHDSDNSGYAYAGLGDRGIYALGNNSGAYFGDGDDSGYAIIGYGDDGIAAYGELRGGVFRDSDSTGYAYLANGDQGLAAYGGITGGYFQTTNNTSSAYIAHYSTGIKASGTNQGGDFQDSDQSGSALVGYGDIGIQAVGREAGAQFWDMDDYGSAYVGYGSRGIEATGMSSGGYFNNNGYSGYAYVSYVDYGIAGYGDTGGGYFDDLNTTSYGRVGYDTYKIYGSGTVSFVQNHPNDNGKVIVYSAPEGDEAATYTRGTARLINGEARIALGETFAWVTNPDIGLTAYAVPREECGGLFVAGVTPQELVVKELAGGKSNAVFDYIVFGLRIGFEELSIVQEKEIESFIPSMAAHRKRYEQHPELRKFNPLERHTAMLQQAGIAPVSGSGTAAALKAAIQEYDPAIHGPVTALLGHQDSEPETPKALTGSIGTGKTGSPGPGKPESASTNSPVTTTLVPSIGPKAEDTQIPAIPGVLFPVSEAVEAGDLLTIDLDHPGALRRAATMADPGIVGVAAGPGEEGQVMVAVSGVALLKVDAGFGPIHPRDLLTASPNPGCAMHALTADPGTILGKALETRETGTGLIRVLLMVR